jgi:hypothetical protein
MFRKCKKPFSRLFFYPYDQKHRTAISFQFYKFDKKQDSCFLFGVAFTPLFTSLSLCLPFE